MRADPQSGSVYLPRRYCLHADIRTRISQGLVDLPLCRGAIRGVSVVRGELYSIRKDDSVEMLCVNHGSGAGAGRGSVGNKVAKEE